MEKCEETQGIFILFYVLTLRATINNIESENRSRESLHL